MYWIAGAGGAVGLAVRLLAHADARAGVAAADRRHADRRARGRTSSSMFELTMLGAILATVVTLFVTARLGRRLPRFYDPEVSNGYILVGIERPADDLVSRLSAALEAAGDGRIKTLD